MLVKKERFIIRRLSRSSRKDFSDCKRKGYYTYLYKGTGVTTSVPDLNLLIGLAVHKGMEELLRPICGVAEVPSGRGDISTIGQALASVAEEWESLTRHVTDPSPTYFQQLEEGLVLSKALVLGWWMTRYDDFVAQYEVLSIEEEERVQLTADLVFMARADAVVRERSTGRVLVFNWKTTKQKKDWNTLYAYDVQAWTEALVVEQKLGEPVSGCVFEGFYKGLQLGAIHSTPLIYGHRSSSGEVSPTYRRGWDRFAVWKEMPLEEWFTTLPMELISDQFLRSEPIFKNDAVVQQWMDSLVFAEDAIQHVLAEGSEAERLQFFDQNFSKWNCERCPFKRVCFMQSDMETMMSDNILVPRVDHHLLPGEA